MLPKYYLKPFTEDRKRSLNTLQSARWCSSKDFSHLQQVSCLKPKASTILPSFILFNFQRPFIGHTAGAVDWPKRSITFLSLLKTWKLSLGEDTDTKRYWVTPTSSHLYRNMTTSSLQHSHCFPCTSGHCTPGLCYTSGRKPEFCHIRFLLFPCLNTVMTNSSSNSIIQWLAFHPTHLGVSADRQSTLLMCLDVPDGFVHEVES